MLGRLGASPAAHCSCRGSPCPPSSKVGLDTLPSHFCQGDSSLGFSFGLSVDSYGCDKQSLFCFQALVQLNGHLRLGLESMFLRVRPLHDQISWRAESPRLPHLFSLHSIFQIINPGESITTTIETEQIHGWEPNAKLISVIASRCRLRPSTLTSSTANLAACFNPPAPKDNFSASDRLLLGEFRCRSPLPRPLCVEGWP